MSPYPRWASTFLAIQARFPLIWILGAFLPEKDTTAPMY